MIRLPFKVSILLLFLWAGMEAQSVGGWGNCEFATKVALDAFDPSSSNFDCKKVFVVATSEHYHWDGTAWILDAINIYNTNDTLQDNRTVTMDSKNLTFDGTNDVQISSSGQVILENNTMVLQPSDSGSPDEGVMNTKKSMNFFTDSDNNSTSDDFIWGTNGANVSSSGIDTIMQLADEGQLKLKKYGAATPNFKTGNETYILGVEPDGDIVEMNAAKSAKIFYPPAMTIDASAVVSNQTMDLHAQYAVLYGTPMVGSTSAPAAIPTYDEDELYYYLTDYDTSVLDNVSIDDDGVMTYDIVAIPPDNCVLVTMVFVVK